MNSKEIKNAYIGSTQADKIYLGEELIWSHEDDAYILCTYDITGSSTENIVLNNEALQRIYLVGVGDIDVPETGSTAITYTFPEAGKYTFKMWITGTSIYNRMYSRTNAPSLYSIDLPQGIESIGDYALGSSGDMRINNYRNLIHVGLPSTLKTIGNYALSYNKFSEIKLPYGLKTIGSGFGYMTALVNIDIPSSVTSVGPEFLSNCSSLTDVVIPEGITSLPEYTIQACASLVSATIPSSVTEVRSKYILLNTSQRELIFLSPTPPYMYDTVLADNIKIYVPDEAVDAYKESWSDYAERIYPMSEREDLTPEVYCIYSGGSGNPINIVRNDPSIVKIEQDGVEIPISDGEYTSYPVKDLKEVKITLSKHSINKLFYEVEHLHGVDIKNITAIAPESFLVGEETDNHSILVGMVNKGDIDLQSVGRDAFRNCTKLNYTPEPHFAVFDRAFMNADLVLENCPSNLYCIGDYAYAGTKINFVNSPYDSPYEIGSYIFSGCTNLVSATWRVYVSPGTWKGLFKDSSIQSISNILNVYCGEQFMGCNNLTGHLDVGKLSVARVFKDCKNIESVTVTGGTLVSKECFAGCESLESVTLYSGITSLGSYVFQDCSSLKEIIFQRNGAPTKALTNCLGNPEYTFPIYVPNNYLSSYKKALPSYYKDRIVSINTRPTS